MEADAANRLVSLSIDDLPVADYYYNYMNQRVRKSTVAPPVSIESQYDVSGNLIRESVGTAWQEYVYLNGQRVAAFRSAGSAPGGGTGGCGGAGCSVGENSLWYVMAVNGNIALSPAFLLIALIFRRKGKSLLGLGLISIIACTIVLFSYVTTPAQTEQLEFFYYLNDHQGTPVMVLDENGNIVNNTKLDPFGQVAYEEGIFENNFRFAGQYHDRETGLYNNWNRFYVPSMGRYNRPDPLGIYNNPYPYAINNPLSFVDPSGLQWLRNGVLPPTQIDPYAWNRIWLDPTVQAFQTETSTMAYPIANDFRDGYEAWYGEDFRTGEELVWWERGFSVAGLVCGTGAGARRLFEGAGQVHHLISTPIGRALNKNKYLKGFYKIRDPRFVARAADLESHYGYQTWHRELDKNIVRLIRADTFKTPGEFEAYLRFIYAEPDLARRFPGGF